MKKWIVFGVVAAVLAFLPVKTVFAFGKKRPAPQITLGEIAIAGSGCPAGTSAVEISPDQLTVRMLLETYAAQVGGSEGRSLDRKNCAVAVSVQEIPEGERLIVSQIKLSGHFNVSDATGRVSLETFLAGSQGPKTEKLLDGSTGSSGSLELSQEESVATECGAKSANIRANSSLLLKGIASASSAQVDEITLSMRLEPCEN